MAPNSTKLAATALARRLSSSPSAYLAGISTLKVHDPLTVDPVVPSDAPVRGQRQPSEKAGAGWWTIGVDPGNSGALVAINPARGLLRWCDMPVRIFGAQDNRREIDCEDVATFLAQFQSGIVYLEDVWGLPGDGGVNAFTFGSSHGSIRGVAAGLGFQVKRISPRLWKAQLGLSSDKNASRLLATKFFPSASSVFARVKDDGRAEAALIALWGVFDQGVQLDKEIKLWHTNSPSDKQSS